MTDVPSNLQDHTVPESRKTPFYPALDGLRTLAVGMVFLVHFLPSKAPWGWLGVQVFFVLSGFLITGILYDTRNDKGKYRNFYARRVLRIFPLYYAVLLVGLALVLLTHGHGPAAFWLWFVYLQNFWWLVAHNPVSDCLMSGHGRCFAAVGHLWSLAVEEQFYLLWPLLVFFFRDRRRLMQLCCGLILIRFALAAYWQMHLSPEVLATGITYRMLPTQWDGFLEGGLLALWLRGSPSARLQARSGSIAVVSVQLYIALLAIVHGHPGWNAGQDIFDYRGNFQAIVGIPLSNIVSACVVLAILQPGSLAFRIFHLRPLRSLGKVSYGLYVYHLPAFLCSKFLVVALFRRFHLVRHFDLVHAVLATLVTVAVSYASFHCFEKHFLLLKNRFTSIEASGMRSLVTHRVR